MPVTGYGEVPSSVLGWIQEGDDEPVVGLKAAINQPYFEPAFRSVEAPAKSEEIEANSKNLSEAKAYVLYSFYSHLL